MARRSRFLFHAFGDFGKVAGVAEVLVDACEADVGDVVEGLEAGHDGFADARRRDLVALGFHLPLDAADEPVDLGRVDFALAGGMADRALELGAVEGLALAVLLHDGQVAQLDPLESREARAARFALPAAADGGTILARPAVLNLTVFVGAERAAH